MTEEEAKTKACFRAATFGGSQQLADGPGPNCVASACMAWRATRPVLARVSRARLDDDMPADELELSTRTSIILKRMDLRTVGDIRRTADRTFLRTDNCGRKSINELRELTGAYNGDAQPSVRVATGYCGLAGRPE